MRFFSLSRAVVLIFSIYLASALTLAAASGRKGAPRRVAITAAKKAAPTGSRNRKISKAKPASKRLVASNSRRSSKSRRSRGSRYVSGGPWYEPTFTDSTVGDNVDGEDLVVRRAAVDALGPYNGTVVVTDPSTGRVLTIVNQKLAFRPGFQPCSTVKIYAALAGLSEGVIDRSTMMRLYGRTHMNLTDALAKSNNPYFANIGVRLGYEKIAYYGKLYGLGEKAGLNIAEEQLGSIPDSPPANGGMAMMTSFGEGIKLNPLQLSAMVGAIANGGTLYYMQYPRSQAEADSFVPRIKRHLPIQDSIDELKPGMLGAVEYGTAKRASYDPNEPIFGKTGTCTDRSSPTHLGWFTSFNEVAGRKLVVTVLLTGGRPVNGPVAAGIAGQLYRNLSNQRYFATGKPLSPVALIAAPSSF